MANPTIQITVVGGSDYIFPLLPIDEAGNHVVQKLVDIFPQPVPDSGVPAPSNYLPYRHAIARPPFGVGLKNKYADKRVWDMEADARFPSGIYLPRLVTDPTFPAEVAAVRYWGFAHAMGELFMFGRGYGSAEDADEPILYWGGTNWTDTTSKDDMDINGTGANPSYVVTSMVEHEGRAYASVTVGNRLSTADDFPGIARSSVGSTTAWAAHSHANSTGALTTPYGLQTDGKLMYVSAWASGASTITIKESADDGAAWSNFTANPTIVSARAPVPGNAAVMFGDGSNSSVLDYWLGTAEGLYHIDISAETFTKVHPFTYITSSYTGTVIATPLGLVYTDGPVVYVGNWGEHGWSPVDITSGMDDGVPLAKSGDVTWLAYDPTTNHLAIGKGGLAASRNQSIYFYDFATGLWSACMAKNATANRASFAGIFSAETDGTMRLHFTIDNGVSNDSTAHYLHYISENPDEQTAATFATAGQVTRSRFDGGVHLFKKNFLKGQYVADSLTSDENLSVKYAVNGGSLGSAQSLTSGPVAEAFCDGSTTAVGASAQDIYDEITMARAGGTTTNTPKIQSLGWAYEVSGLKSDGTPLRSWTVRISLDPNDYQPGADIESSKDARDKLEIIMGTVPLIKLAIGQDAPIGSEVKVRMQPYQSVRKLGDVRDQVDVPYDPNGYVDVEFREVI